MFHSARIKLTTWYLIIIMVISLLFSLVIYTNVNKEYQRFEKLNEYVLEREDEQFITPGRYLRLIQIRNDLEAIKHARFRLVSALILLNCVILGVAGSAGYFLAGKTLQPIQKMLDKQKRFIADASHELRTPLTSLRTEIEVALRGKKLSSTDAKKLLASNLEEVVSLQSLSDNLLDLAQNGTFINPRALRDIAIEDILSAAIKIVDPVARKNSISIKYSSLDGKVTGIKERLIQLFVILLDNAVKYSPDESIVMVESELKKNKLVVSVQNTGDGIPGKDLLHIFERFYRGDTSRSQTSGYGLGLAIARKIVESHGGSITVSSIPHKQTVFTVSFPL